jgi:hypothetical protein
MSVLTITRLFKLMSVRSPPIADWHDCSAAMFPNVCDTGHPPCLLHLYLF